VTAALEGEDVLQAGWGSASIQARGAVIVILIMQIVGMGAATYHHYDSESERRLVEIEARVEVMMIKAKQQIIMDTITRYCGAGYGSDVAEETRRLESWYADRKRAIQQKRDGK
jgi:hypothetical protein